MGMLTSYALAQKGFSVQLLESQRCGREASWAGGGIVSPLNPWDYPASISRLTKLSQNLYPALVNRLKGQTGIDPELYLTGLLTLPPNRTEHSNNSDKESSLFTEALGWADQYDIELEIVNQGAIYQQQPGLAPGILSGLWMPAVCNIRNPRLLSALKTVIFQEPRINVQENCPVVELLIEGEKARGAATKTKKFYAGTTVVTSGAWSHQLLSKTLVSGPIWPIRGQMLLYKPGPQLLNTIVLSGNKYLIPRKDGHILVGSTLEDVGFDKTTTEHACTELRGFAESMLPALANYPILQQWAGLRPASPAGIPQIGPICGYENLFINAGHFRNGVVLAPGSVQILMEQMLGESSSLDCSPYQPLAH